MKKNTKNKLCFVNNSLFENQTVCVATLAAALFGGQPLVSLLGDGQTDSLSSGQGHPRLVALETQTIGGGVLVKADQRGTVYAGGKQVESETWCYQVLFCGFLLNILKDSTFKSRQDELLNDPQPTITQLWDFFLMS